MRIAFLVGYCTIRDIYLYFICNQWQRIPATGADQITTVGYVFSFLITKVK